MQSLRDRDTDRADSLPPVRQASAETWSGSLPPLRRCQPRRSRGLSRLRRAPATGLDPACPESPGYRGKPGADTCSGCGLGLSDPARLGPDSTSQSCEPGSVAPKQGDQGTQRHTLADTIEHTHTNQHTNRDPHTQPYANADPNIHADRDTHPNPDGYPYPNPDLHALADTTGHCHTHRANRNAHAHRRFPGTDRA